MLGLRMKNHFNQNVAYDNHSYCDENLTKNKKFTEESMLKINKNLSSRSKALALVLVVVALVFTSLFATEMVAIKGFENHYIPDQTLSNLLNYFKYLGYDQINNIYQHEESGFGFTFHSDRMPFTLVHGVGIPNTQGIIYTPLTGLIPSDKRFTASTTFPRWRSGDAFRTFNNQNGQSMLSVLDQEVNLDYKIATVMLHKRDLPTSNIIVPDEQVFVYNRVDRSYSFIHEGEMSMAQQQRLISYIQSHSPIDPQLNDILASGSDSALMFVNLMLRIEENEMDILRGLNASIHDLIYAPPFIDYSPNKFIFSDSYDMYAFQWNSSDLYVYRDPDEKLIMITTDNAVTLNSSYYKNQVFNNLPIIIPNQSLLYYPFHGTPVEFKYIATLGAIEMVKRYDLYHPAPPLPPNNVHWMSFPVYGHPSFPNNYTSALNLNSLATWSIQTQYGWIDESGNSVPPISEDLDYRIGIKFKGIDPVYIHTGGDIKPVADYVITDPSEPQWLAYNVANSQSLEDALGDYFSDVYRVDAENWYYDEHSSTNEWNKHRPMEFGKMYVVYFQSIHPHFTWNDSRNRGGDIIANQPARGKLNRVSRHFSFEKQPNYEVIDILSLSKNQENFTEIGVFAGNVCVGATRIEDFPVQILIYTKGYEGSQLTLRATDHTGAVTQINPIVQAEYSIGNGVYDYNDRVLIAGDIDYVVVKLNNDTGPTENIPATITTHNNYPNPFNPTTSINFNISNLSRVTVEVFNIKGQKVKTLLNDTLQTGSHSVVWDGNDSHNMPTSSGLYFYRISTENSQTTGKMILLK